MPKPTLLQSLLNQPSQTYYHPPQRDYHSTKTELIRAAASPAGQLADSSGVSHPPLANSHLSSATLDRLSVSSYASAASRISSPTLKRPQNPNGSATGSVVNGKRPAIRQSLASSSSYASFKTAEDSSQVSRAPPNPVPSASRRSRSASQVPSRKAPSRDSDAEESEEETAFFTPRASQLSSPRISQLSTTAMLEPQALASALLPLTAPSRPSADEDTPPVSRTPSRTSISSVASTTSGGDDSPSVLSSPSHITTSTRITSPSSSDRGNDVETITIASSARSRPTPAAPKSPPSTPSSPKSAPSSPASVRSGSSNVRRHPPEPVRKLTYTDADWAKDVRHLSGSKKERITPPGKQRSMTLPTDIASTVSSSSYRSTAGPSRAVARKQQHRNSGRSRRSRGRMSALWEEDESEEGSTGLSSTEPSRAPSPIHERSLPPSPLKKSSTLPDLQDDSTPSESHSDGTPDARLQRYARGQRRNTSNSLSILQSPESSNAHLPTHSLPTPFPASPPSSPINGYTGLKLAQAGYSNVRGKVSAEGHVDLVRAGVAQSSMATVEVIRGVAAQHFSSSSAPSAPTRRPSFTRTLTRSFSLSLRPKRRESATPVHLQGTLPLPVAFTAHVQPPSYVPESHVLVQVFAVALDGLDSLVVQEKSGWSMSAGTQGKASGKGAGFVPGRGFVGRVVECGWAVREDVCKRGEWVVGLLDVRKCGALTEFIVVERHRIHRAPQPRTKAAALFPPPRRTHGRNSSLPGSPLSPSYPSSPLAPSPLTVEELALLPLCGLPAHRAVRTFSDVIVMASRAPGPSPKQTRALIIHGHDGAGALAIQMLVRRGVRVSVQVPESAVGGDDGPSKPASMDLPRSPKRSPKKLAPTSSRRARLEARVLGWGAEEMLVGEPLEVLTRLAQDSESFDMVLDTIGGVAVWNAAQRLLAANPARSPASEDVRGRSHAQFTTLVGDVPHRVVPTAQDNLRSGLRSLRRAVSTTPAGASKSSPAKLSRGEGRARLPKRTVGYSLIGVAADVDFDGEDVRDSLGAVVTMAEHGWVRPWTGEGDDAEGARKVVPFERCPEVFRRDFAGPRGVLADGGTCVVKIVG